MPWAVAAFLLGLLIQTFLHHKERQSWGKERQGLVAAALAPVNPVGSSLVRTPVAAKTDQVKRPMPIDL